jgi:uncharacterized protein (UPF0332 family)
VSELWDKALEFAQDARLLLEAERYNGAASRAYYAMFNAGRALLVEKHGISLEAIKRHATIYRLFSVHFVATGQFDGELAKALGRASEVRKTADYDEMAVTAGQAKQICDAMERFLAMAESIRASK